MFWNLQENSLPHSDLEVFHTERQACVSGCLYPLPRDYLISTARLLETSSGTNLQYSTLLFKVDTPTLKVLSFKSFVFRLIYKNLLLNYHFNFRNWSFMALWGFIIRIQIQGLARRWQVIIVAQGFFFERMTGNYSVVGPHNW